jgi:hypothetical protein
MEGSANTIEALGASHLRHRIRGHHARHGDVTRLYVQGEAMLENTGHKPWTKDEM